MKTDDFDLNAYDVDFKIDFCSWKNGIDFFFFLLIINFYFNAYPYYEIKRLKKYKV